MRFDELAGAAAFLADHLDQLPVLIELSDTGVVEGRRVALTDENVTIRGYKHVRRRIEDAGVRRSDSRLAQPHQDFSVGTELYGLLAFAVFVSIVRHPDVSVLVHGQTVRLNE